MSIESTAIYTTEEGCRNYLKTHREKVGIICKRCSRTHHLWIQSRSLWRCQCCSFQTTLKSGTLFESTKLPLVKWFSALRLLCNNKKGISACEMRRQLGLKRYEPVWYMMHKIRMAMKNYNVAICNPVELLAREIALTRCVSVRKSGNSNSRNSTPIHLLTILENNANFESTGGIRLHISSYENLNYDQIHKQATSLLGISYDRRNSRAKKIIQPRGILFSDDCSVIQSIKPSKWWISKSLINLHRILNGIHHLVSKKYMQLHLDEFTFKFNNRFQGDLSNFLIINSLNIRVETSG